ncbi:hypothetical protein [Mycobacterium uberis]|uniref:hypothetical protein n=1 Tax=Mycobacterium uberis TaxID=2162698 RepID=UPI0014027CC6|nr:hypothetical protein [Mycobacterium uberis]
MNHTGIRQGLRPLTTARYGDSGSWRRVLIDLNAAMRPVGALQLGLAYLTSLRNINDRQERPEMLKPGSDHEFLAFGANSVTTLAKKAC